MPNVISNNLWIGHPSFLLSNRAEQLILLSHNALDGCVKTKDKINNRGWVNYEDLKSFFTSLNRMIKFMLDIGDDVALGTYLREQLPEKTVWSNNAALKAAKDTTVNAMIATRTALKTLQDDIIASGGEFSKDTDGINNEDIGVSFYTIAKTTLPALTSTPTAWAPNSHNGTALLTHGENDDAKLTQLVADCDAVLVTADDPNVGFLSSIP